MSDQAHEQKLDARRNWVRLLVAYGAAAFLFVGGGLLIFGLFKCAKNDETVTVFNTVLPVSASIIAYGFADSTKAKK